MARAILAVVEPLVDLLLELGVTSPEAESLFRAVFVHRTRDRLAAQHPNGAIPSDVRVALVCGVHRNFVRRILAEPPRISPGRARKGHQAERLLSAWYTDPRYLDNSGKPRDIPERGPEPSFQSLSSSYLPRVAPGVLLDELHRAGAVQLVADRRVRVRSRSIRARGMSLSSVNEMADLAKEFLETQVHNLRHPDAPRFVQTLPLVPVDESRLAAVRHLISTRSETFLKGLEAQLSSEGGKRGGRTRRRARVGLAVSELTATHRLPPSK